MTALVATAGQIDPLVYNLKLSADATAKWEKLRTELHTIAQAFNVREPYFESQGISSLSMSSDSRSCIDQVGVMRAQQLAERCRQVSPATSAMRWAERMRADRG